VRQETGNNCYDYRGSIGKEVRVGIWEIAGVQQVWEKVEKVILFKLWEGITDGYAALAESRLAATTEIIGT